MATEQPIRVRFAPSPTGFLHIGGARTALFNWLFARHHGGAFILRIDDTDQARSTDESTQGIYDSMEWLGLDWDEGPKVGGPHTPYIQSDRGDRYHKYVQQLLDIGNAYRCYCTPEELDQMRTRARVEKRSQGYPGKCRHLTEADRQKLEAEGRKSTIRLKIPEGAIIVRDLVLDVIKFEAETLDDFIIVRSNGSPLYNFTSTIDDIEMGITHIIRGADHLSNTPKQLLISQALGFDPPQYAHLPMVLGSSKGEKLSKRHGATSVEQYRDDGYLPEALINFLVRLGWSYDDKEEIFSVDRLIERFDLERVGKSGSVFDIKKLQWLNGHYITQLDLSARTDAVIPFLQKGGLLGEERSRTWLEQFVEAVGDRLETLADITAYSYLFIDDFDYDPKAVKKWWKGNPAEILQGLRDVLAAVEVFETEPVEAAIWAHIEAIGISRIKTMQPLRVALSGEAGGPGLFDIVVLLGREKVLERLDRAICHIRKTS